MKHIEHRGRKPMKELKQRINAMVVAGYSFQQIADHLGLRSRQLVRHHFITYRKDAGLDK